MPHAPTTIEDNRPQAGGIDGLEWSWEILVVEEWRSRGFTKVLIVEIVSGPINRLDFKCDL